MAIKRKLTLATGIPDGNGFQTLTGFEVNYIYVNDGTLTVYLNPPSAPAVTINMDGSGAIAGKGNIVLTPTQTTKVTNFIQAIEDACKANLDFAWPVN